MSIVQHLWDTPRYRKKLVESHKTVRGLAILTRGSKVSESLLTEVFPKDPSHKAKVSIGKQVLDTDLTDDDAIKVLQMLNEVEFSLARFEEVADMLKLVESSSTYDLIRRAVFEQMAARIVGNPTSLRRVFRHLEDPLVGRVLLEMQGNSPLLELYRRLLKQQKQSGGDLQKIVDDWLQSPGDADLKGDFLLAQLGREDSQFNRYLKLVPEEQHAELWQVIDRESSLAPYLNFARRNNMEERLLARGVLKSFELQRIEMPNGHSFEIQRTQETQIKWEAVMGNNPGKFEGDNHPVERVSWEDVQEYIAKLNESLGLKGCDGTPKSAKGCYRLPTEEEWRYALQKERDTRFSFGDDESLLPGYAWSSSNANGKTHPVGLKRETSHGLYDMHGNVWEWMQDPWSRSLQRGVDHLHDHPGSYRVIRGGSWGSSAQDLRSAIRIYDGPDDGNSFVGFRLVRTL